MMGAGESVSGAQQPDFLQHPCLTGEADTWGIEWRCLALRTFGLHVRSFVVSFLQAQLRA